MREAGRDPLCIRHSNYMAWRQEHGKPGHAAPLDGEKDLSWKPGGGGQAAKERAKELRKYAEQRALQKEIKEREARRNEKAAAECQLKEIKEAVTSLDISAEDVRPICRFFELGKCNKGAKCKYRHEAAAAAPEGGADAPSPAFDVAEMPADAWLQVLSRLGVGGPLAGSHYTNNPDPHQPLSALTRSVLAGCSLLFTRRHRRHAGRVGGEARERLRRRRREEGRRGEGRRGEGRRGGGEARVLRERGLHGWGGDAARLLEMTRDCEPRPLSAAGRAPLSSRRSSCRWAI